jgi:hypothetical protein
MNMMTRIGKTSSKSRRAAGCVTGPAADPITWSACCLLVALHDHARRRRRTIMNRSKPLRYVSKSNTPGSHRRRAPGARVRSSPAAPCCGPAQARARCMHTGLVDRFLERRRRIRRGARHQTSLAWTGGIVENGGSKAAHESAVLDSVAWDGDSVWEARAWWDGNTEWTRKRKPGRDGRGAPHRLPASGQTLHGRAQVRAARV